MIVERKDAQHWSSSKLARALAGLGYAGFAYMEKDEQRPEMVLLHALTADDLEIRVVEALPWVLLEYLNLDWEWLLAAVAQMGYQNRLGFIVSLAKEVADKRRAIEAGRRLGGVLARIEALRLETDDTLCQSSMSMAERRWLLHSRSAIARHWGLLTDLSADQLPYAA